jgi:hypothetical protein
MADVFSDRATDVAFLARLVESLPAGTIVIDQVGIVRFATREAAALVEQQPADLVGQSVLTMVDHDTAWAYAAAVAMAGDFTDVVTGPLRVTVVGRSGRQRSADLWALNRLDDPVLSGIVCILTPATAAVALGEAVSAIATDAPFTAVVGHVVRAMAGHPTTAEAVLLASGSSGFRAVGDQRDELPDPALDGPWAIAVETGVRQLIENVDELPPALAADAREKGFSAVWAEPVGAGQGSPIGALVLWRTDPGRPTPNELNIMFQGATILTMAWQRHENLA